MDTANLQKCSFKIHHGNGFYSSQDGRVIRIDAKTVIVVGSDGITRRVHKRNVYFQ